MSFSKGRGYRACLISDNTSQDKIHERRMATCTVLLSLLYIRAKIFVSMPTPLRMLQTNARTITSAHNQRPHCDKCTKSDNRMQTLYTNAHNQTNARKLYTQKAHNVTIACSTQCDNCMQTIYAICNRRKDRKCEQPMKCQAIGH